MQPRFKLTLSTASQKDDFNWSIAGNTKGTSPNILSELKWFNLRGQTINAAIETRVWKNMIVYASATRSATTRGEANDSDYESDNRTNRVYNADLKSNKGNTTEYKAIIGYSVVYKAFNIQPFLGYGENKQLMYLLDDDISDLNTLYEAKWKGVLLGISIKSPSIMKFNVEIKSTYQQLNYKALADWNLNDNFQHPISFKHLAKGFSYAGNVAFIYALNKTVQPFISLGFSSWQTGAGIDELYYKDGTIALTRLNEAERKSFNAGFGLQFYF